MYDVTFVPTDPQTRNNKPVNDLDESLQCISDTEAPACSGYWKGNLWRSFQCKNHQFTPNQIGLCLKNKNVYIIGDSTLRQLFFVLCSTFNAPCAFAPVDKTPLHLDVPQESYVADFNVNLNFKFHSLRNGIAVNTFSISFLDVDFIDSLGRGGNCNVILGVGVGIHFPQWSRDAFIERLTHLKESIVRFLHRCPNASVFVKGPHMSSPYLSLQSDITRSAYFVYQMHLLMQEYFKGTGVYYIDTWDMNLSFPSRNLIHMPYEVVRQELFLALSYVCQT